MIKPPANTMDFRDLGRAVGQLQRCFYPNISRLLDSESRLQMNGSVLHWSAELATGLRHLVSAVAPLRRLVMSDLELTEGSHCIIPNVRCLPHTPANVSTQTAHEGGKRGSIIGEKPSILSLCAKNQPFAALNVLHCHVKGQVHGSAWTPFCNAVYVQ